MYYKKLSLQFFNISLQLLCMFDKSTALAILHLGILRYELMCVVKVKT